MMDKGFNKATGAKHQFSADRPIASRKEDLLGRTGFADSIAASIKGWKDNESLVIALYGAWGAGKSSIKNMILESIRSGKPDASLITLEFNPWQWSGQDRLAQAFFGEIGLVLGRTDTGRNAKKRAARWRTYAATWKVGSFIARGFHKLVLILIAVVAATGLTGSLPDGYWLKTGSTTIGLVALVLLALEQFYGFIGTLSEKIASFFEESSKAESQSLAEQKEELSNLLRDLKKQILVVMDDIDRLTAEEIRLLFQLVKANADFPNLIYLLLFQRDIVEASLDATPSIRGHEFLEKIIQVGFSIPRIERPRLEKVLLAGLDDLLGDEEVRVHFDQKRWGNIFVGALRPFFQTLRHVYRYLATLSFHVSLFRSTGSFEVNPVDLIALEVIRVFEPIVYQALPDAKVELTDVLGRRSRNTAIEAEMKERVLSLVNRASEANRPQVREVIKQLFPPAEWVFGGPGYGADFSERWFREQRACHPDVFDRYFNLTIPHGDISRAELDQILSLVGNREGLAAKLRSLNERELLGIALDRLEAYKETIEIRYAVPFVTALFDVGDELPEARGGMFSGSLSPEMHASRIIYWFLKQEKDISKRGQVLKEATTASTGLYLPIMTTSHEGSEKRRKDPDAFNVNEEDLRELEQICVKKIEEASVSGTLATSPHLAYILYRWREWSSPERPKQWCEKLIQSPEGGRSILTGFLQRSTSQGIGDYVSEEHWRINLKNLEEFVSIDNLERVILQGTPNRLPEKEQKAIKAFQKALKRRRDGKSDDARWDDDD